MGAWNRGLLPGLLLVLVASACGKDETTPTAAKSSAPPAAATVAPAMPVAPPPSLATLNAYLAAWNEHDIIKAGSFLSEDVEYFDVSFAGLQHGRDAAMENGIGVFMRGMPDLNWQVRSVPIVGNDGIAFEWTLTGTNTGTWGGIPATRQKINLKGMTFLRFRNGKISYQAVYYDGATLNRQLGL